MVTTTKVAATSYYVCLPGQKAQRGEWEDLTTREPQRNELKLGADHVWTGAYNGVIAEMLKTTWLRLLLALRNPAASAFIRRALRRGLQTMTNSLPSSTT